MSYQKTKRIESPLKGKYYSMLRLENKNQTDSFYLRSHTIKRKPIFDHKLQKSSLSIFSPSRKKIFSHKEKPKSNNHQSHFSKVTQSNLIQLISNDHQDQILPYNKSFDSISSSSIGSNQGLQQIRKKLFPSTPIKKIAHDFQDFDQQEQFFTNSWKKLHFIESNHPLKSQFLTAPDDIEKTVVKINFNALIKSEDESIKNKKINETISKVNSNFNKNDPQNSFNSVNLLENKNLKKPKKDLAKQLRQLHQKLSAQSRSCMKFNSFTECLKRQNQFLRKQNLKLQQKPIYFQMVSKKNDF